MIPASINHPDLLQSIREYWHRKFGAQQDLHPYQREAYLLEAAAQARLRLQRKYLKYEQDTLMSIDTAERVRVARETAKKMKAESTNESSAR